MAKLSALIAFSYCKCSSDAARSSSDTARSLLLPAAHSALFTASYPAQMTATMPPQRLNQRLEGRSSSGPPTSPKQQLRSDPARCTGSQGQRHLSRSGWEVDIVHGGSADQALLIIDGCTGPLG